MDLNDWHFQLLSIAKFHFFQQEHSFKNVQYRKDIVQCLARDGRVINFTAPEHIPSQVHGLFNLLLPIYHQHGQKQSEISKVLAMLWMGLICIHPFINNNGKITMAFIHSLALAKNFLLINESEVLNYLIEGNCEIDTTSLTQIFSKNLKGFL